MQRARIAGDQLKTSTCYSFENSKEKKKMWWCCNESTISDHQLIEGVLRIARRRKWIVLSARVFLLWWAVHLLSSRTGGRDQLTTLQHRGEIKRMFFPRPGKHKKKEKRKKCIYIFYTSAIPRARVHGPETHPAFRCRLLRQGLIYTISSGLYGPGPALLFPGGVEGHQRFIFSFLFGDRGQIEWQDTLWNRKRILYKGDEHLLVEWPKDLHINRGG